MEIFEKCFQEFTELVWQCVKEGKGAVQDEAQGLVWPYTHRMLVLPTESRIGRNSKPGAGFRKRKVGLVSDILGSE